MFPSKESPFFLLFDRLFHSSQKILLPKIRYQEDDKGLIDLKAIRYALELALKTCISRQKSDNDQLQDSLAHLNLVYLDNVKRH